MRRPAAIALALACTSAACALPHRGGIGALSPEQLPSVSVLRGAIAARRETLHSLRSDASITVSSPERSGSARQVLLVEQPDRLRVEVFSPFGTIFVLASAGGQLAAYVREQNRLYRGAATPSNLAQYASIELALPDVVAVLLGEPPERAASYASVFPDPTSGQIRLRQQTPGGAQVVAFAPDALLPVGVEEIDPRDRVVWRAAFGDYATVDGVPVAHRIRIEIPQQQSRVEVALESPEVNPTLAPSLFALEAPPGSREVPLDAAVQ